MTNRIALIDVLRGIALIAMTLYHFTWDLEYFHWLTVGTTSQQGWVLFARGIATSFLFLVGVSLVLAHSNAINWRKFGWRFGQVALAAMVISAATYYFVPETFIFFGILHAVALFSLLGLMFLRLPFWLNLALAIGVLIVGQYFFHSVFQTPYLWWVGLSPEPPVSNDYVPLFPWFSATLAGISAGQFAQKFGWFKKIAKINLPKSLQTPISFIGRNSLVYYLVHQLVLIGLIWAFTQVSGPVDRTAEFRLLCERPCVIHRDKKFCTAYCGCMAQTMKRVKLFDSFMSGSLKDENLTVINSAKRTCEAFQKE